MDMLCDTVSNLQYHPPPYAGLAGLQASGSRSFFLFCVLTSAVVQMGTHAFILHLIGRIKIDENLRFANVSKAAVAAGPEDKRYAPLRRAILISFPAKCCIMRFIAVFCGIKKCIKRPDKNT
ncbi:hypothetical protein [Klebsiella oxytoca]|uniref:hypothetical protein n=1 Tax=Klebsiella oxytoca TaxID=571 RepID=UPI0018A80793|nr:hypothetical protein [Klebsiella oxytoca]